MPEIEAEMIYYEGDVKRLKGVEIKEEEVKKIGEKHGVNVDVKVSLMRGAMQAIRKFTITLSGDEESSIRRSVEDAVKLYGKPNSPLFAHGSKKKGKQIVESVVKEEFR